MVASHAEDVSQCPVFAGPEERKSAEVARRGGVLQGEPVTDFAGARALLRDETARQAGFMADLVGRFSRMKQPILYLSGEPHRRQRKATARFFAPRVINGRYRDLVVSETERLLNQFKQAGRADLDDLSLDLAVTVAGEIVGLTDSKKPGMAARLESFTTSRNTSRALIPRLIQLFRSQFRVGRFFRLDVAPSIAARKTEPRDDVISHLIAEGYSNPEILTECVTYGAAGMITTREFITMSAWRMFEDPVLRDHFLAADEDGKLAVLEEVLRVEPVVGMLYRRMPDSQAPLVIDIRAANADPDVVGQCPHRIDPSREVAPKTTRAVMSFGDGAHRCPGAQVAILEAAVFLDAFFRLPGVRLEKAPEVGWNALITGYELRGATVACDRA